VASSQEELTGFAIEHGVPERIRRDPPIVAHELGHRRPIPLAAKRRVGVIELGKLELGRERRQVITAWSQATAREMSAGSMLCIA
jgi:hypothetical protein